MLGLQGAEDCVCDQGGREHDDDHGLLVGVVLHVLVLCMGGLSGLGLQGAEDCACDQSEGEHDHVQCLA